MEAEITESSAEQLQRNSNLTYIKEENSTLENTEQAISISDGTVLQTAQISAMN